jgi:putative transposase
VAGAGPDRRQFAAEQLNRKWYGDCTEIATDEGRLFLDSVLDMGSRRIVGFALGEHHDTELAYAALAMAVAVRGGKKAISGVIFHTDSEYVEAGNPERLDPYSEGRDRMLVPGRSRAS